MNMGIEDGGGGGGTRLSPTFSSPPSVASSKVNINVNPEKKKEERIAEFFEKAKFYTSVCLGRF